MKPNVTATELAALGVGFSFVDKLVELRSHEPLFYLADSHFEMFFALLNVFVLCVFCLITKVSTAIR